MCEEEAAPVEDIDAQVLEGWAKNGQIIIADIHLDTLEIAARGLSREDRVWATVQVIVGAHAEISFRVRPACGLVTKLGDIQYRCPWGPARLCLKDEEGRLYPLSTRDAFCRISEVERWTWRILAHLGGDTESLLARLVHECAKASPVYAYAARVHEEMHAPIRAAAAELG